MDVLIGHYWTMTDIYEENNAACINYLNLNRIHDICFAVLLQLFLSQPSRDQCLCLLFYFYLILSHIIIIIR